jgi:proteic killer suppression protein
MIKSFSCKATANLFEMGQEKKFSSIKKVALRKLDMIDAAQVLNDLRSPPGNRLKSLTGDRDGEHSIRINRQWRIYFIWKDDSPHNVEIVDYH